MNSAEVIEKLTNQIYSFMPKLASGIVVLLIGLFLVGLVANGIKNRLLKSKIEEELALFLSKIVKVLLQITILLSALSILGVKTTSFLAVLGSAGLAIGLALQGSLSNFAGGVLILVLKPFGVNDFIEYSGHSGVVETIDVFTTKIRTADNRLIIIPNGPLANGVVINYSAKETRRNEWVFCIGYTDDISKAKGLINDYLQSSTLILKDPAPFIAVKELADSSVNIVVRAWTKQADYWTVHHQTLEELKLIFDREKISIPFPQQDVHLYKHQS